MIKNLSTPAIVLVLGAMVFTVWKIQDVQRSADAAAELREQQAIVGGQQSGSKSAINKDVTPTEKKDGKSEGKKEPGVRATDDWEIGIPDGPPDNRVSIPRVGGVGVTPPEILKKISPTYPERAIKIKLQGYVILEAIIRVDGSIDDVKVLRGLGKGKFGFEDEATKCLKQWTFKPGKFNGKKSDVRMNVKIDFVLQ